MSSRFASLDRKQVVQPCHCHKKCSQIKKFEETDKNYFWLRQLSFVPLALSSNKKGSKIQTSNLLSHKNLLFHRKKEFGQNSQKSTSSCEKLDEKIAVGNPRVRALSELDSFRSYYMFRNMSAFGAMATIWSQ